MHILNIPNQYPNNLSGSGGQIDRAQYQALSDFFEKMSVLNIRTTDSDLGLRIKDVLGSIDSIEKINDKKIPLYVLKRRWSLYGIPIPRPQLLKKLFLNSLEYYIDNEGKPDVIHASRIMPAGYFAMIAKETFQIPYVITEGYSAYLNKTIKSKFLPLINKITNEADSLIGVSPAIIKGLENTLPSTKNKWRLVPHVLPPEYLNNSELSSSQGIEEEIKILSIGTLDKNKGQDRLLMAIKALKKRSVNKIKLTVIGTGIMANNLKQYCKEHNLVEIVELKGNLSRADVKSEMNSHHVLMVTSYVETFSIVTIEALSMGMPVISTPCGGPQSLINESNGIILNDFNPESIAHGIEKFIGNYKNFDRKLISKNALQTYSPSKVAEQYKNIYLDL